MALNVVELEECVTFYTTLLGMRLEWQPDADNYYLSSGTDNLALHRALEPPSAQGQRLDHVGFIMSTPKAVDDWYHYLSAAGVVIKTAPRTHRDGARSFYCLDPAGNGIQIIYHPPLASRSA